MPELPEVETIRKDLSKLLPHQKIKRVFFNKPKMIHPSVNYVKKILTGNAITKVGRRGKMLYFILADGNYLLVHLKMTGQLVWQPSRGRLVVGGHPITGVSGVPNKFTHVVVEFSGGAKLFFNDMRQFGYWKVVSFNEFNNISKSNFGPEPLTKDFMFNDFLEKCRARKRSPIKAVILDQKVVAGVGNIYADESLWMAKIKPGQTAGKISKAKLYLLFKAIIKVLAEAVKYRGTTFNSYVDSFGREGTYWSHRRVYGRNGLSCKRCGKIILKTKTAGRGTHYCPKCQK